MRPLGKAKAFFRGVPFGVLVSDGSPAEGAYNRHGVLMFSVLIDGGVAFLFEDEIEVVEVNSEGG